MPHDDATYLAHMLDTARRAAAKASAVTVERFEEDENLQLALVHLIQVIGEAAGRVSGETRLRHPEVPWKQIIGMRHRVVHDYLAVDLEIVWRVCASDLPQLVTGLEKIVPREPPPTPGPSAGS